MKKPKPVVLIVLDGWGHSPAGGSNAITSARTPTWDSLMQHCPHTLISGSGEDVGLPEGQMGNSEVGHITMGAGRVIYQDLTLIAKAIREGDFFKNPVLKNAFAKAQQTHQAVHIMALLSDGGVHSHEDQIFACLEMAQQHHCAPIYLHAFLDGRDTPPQSAQASLEKCEQVMRSIPGARIASICGRYYAMDRDQRWERVKVAYDLIAYGQAPFTAHSSAEALALAYARGETDEFVQPTLIVPPGEKAVSVQPGDIMIYMNFRSDRARALTNAFVNPNFNGFARPNLIPLGEFVTLTEYDPNLPVKVAFPNEKPQNVLGEFLQNQQRTQLHIAETEKYAHVTFFFNGGIETPFTGETRILVPSPKVATYDLQPQMSAPLLTEKLVEGILSGQYDFIVCNYANADMVGHTGNFAATVIAIETLDECLDKVTKALQQVGGQALITSDHGNAECMQDPLTGVAHTAHTTSLVPLVLVGNDTVTLATGGKLSDIAPTLLAMMEFKPPTEMTGHTLIQKNAKEGNV